MIIVGSEALLRHDVSPDTLIGYINRVKREVPGTPVATADAHEVLLSHPQVVGVCDLVFAHLHRFWEGAAADRAIRTLRHQYEALRATYPDKQIIVGEAGWPSNGNTVGEAVASPENAAFYFLNFTSWAKANDVEYFYFEAFDEPWKAAHEGPQGAHWGLWTSEGALKVGMQPVFDGQTMEDNWSREDPCAPGSQVLRLTYVPPTGSEDFIEGQVCNVAPSEHRVAVAIRVGAGWWTKPYWNRPLTRISADGSWSCDVVTGGNDHDASAIAAFLVPVGYDPILLRGETMLPASLSENAVATVQVERTADP